MTKQLWQMFRTFFLIGGFTFGGGYAMLEMIREEIVTKKQWLTEEEFVDLFAVAQSLPGVFAVNISIFVGYRIRKLVGAITCGLATVLPSFLIILVVAMFFSAFRDNPHVIRIFKGLRPAVVALIAAPVITTWKALRLSAVALWIPATVALAVWLLGVSPILVIILAGVGGWIYTKQIAATLKKQDKRKEDDL